MQVRPAFLVQEREGGSADGERAQTLFEHDAHPDRRNAFEHRDDQQAESERCERIGLDDLAVLEEPLAEERRDGGATHEIAETDRDDRHRNQDDAEHGDR